MAVVHDVAGWVDIAFGAVLGSRSLRGLVNARRGGTLFRAASVADWLGLDLSVLVLIAGWAFLHYGSRGGTWVDWMEIWVIGMALILLPFSGIVARRNAGLPWWRFGMRALTPSLAAAYADPAFPPALSTSPEVVPEVIGEQASALIQRIKKVQFSTTRLRPGYDEREVDNYLDMLIEVLSTGGQLDQAELRNPQFATTRLRPGYDIGAVNAFLTEVANSST
jgi:DivIVA domain-containing protein